MTGSENRQAFQAAMSGFVRTVHGLQAREWERPALGEWDVRSLVGHTSRALSTIPAYLHRSAPGSPVRDAVGYFLAVLDDSVSAEEQRTRDAGIAARGREAAAALGDDPVGRVDTLAAQVRDLLAATPDDAPVGSPAGPMTLIGYLPTRTFELTVHTLDLTRAVGREAPPELEGPIAACCTLAGAVAGQRRRAADLLLLLTGREGLPAGLSAI